jgi:hypothetical protein
MEMAGTLRLGAFAAFVAVLAFGIALAMRLALAANKPLEIALAMVAAGAVALTFWTTKSLFNACHYRRADIAIFGIIAMFALFALLVLADAGGWIYSAGSIGGKTANIALFGTAFALSILFPIQAMSFARSGGGVWKAIGIVYLITSVLLTLAVATAIYAKAPGRGFEGLIAWIFGASFIGGGLIGTAALILHGTGLAMSADAMRARPA